MWKTSIFGNDYTKVRTEPFEIGYLGTDLHPVESGYARKGKSFVHGHGYVNLKKKAMTEPLHFEPTYTKETVDTLLNYYNKYGIYVLRYALGRESVNDCCNYYFNDEIVNFIRHGHKLFEYYAEIDSINTLFLNVLTEKWNVRFNGEWIHHIKELPQLGSSTCSFRDPIQFIPTQRVLFFTMNPHIDWIEYEKMLNSFIIHFTPKGKYDSENNDDILRVWKWLDDESVKEKLRYISNDEIVDRAETLAERFSF
jgi:hypothetical protein